MNETQNQRNPDGKENTFNGRKKRKRAGPSMCWIHSRIIIGRRMGHFH